MNLKQISFFCILLFLILAVVVGAKTKTEKLSGALDVKYETPPKRSVYLGAWVFGFWDNDTKKLDTKVASEFEKTLGKKLAITNIYAEWAYLKDPKLLINLHEISAQGWTPIISSNPYFFKDCPDKGENLYKTVASGDCDQFLREASRNLKSFQKPVMLRLAWEMNLPDMYWSVDRLKSTPEDFKGAWRRFYNISKEEGAENIVWVLSFNTTNSVTIPYVKLYPGDEYVDWVAIDGYNWGNAHTWSGWQEFEGVFRNSYNELTDITSKPVMLSEVNSAPTGTGGDKAKWISEMLINQVPNNFPKVSAIVFFNENKSDGEKVDWRMEKDPEVVKNLKEGLKNNIYRSSYP